MEISERILLSAEELFFRYGVKSVTMDEIARELGISKKTIYQHFPDKDELVFQVVEKRMVKNRTDMICSVGAGKNTVERVVLMNEVMRKMLSVVNPGILFEIKKYYPRAWQVFQKHMQEHVLIDTVADLRQGIADGLFRSEINVDVMARLRLKEIEFGFDNQWFPPNEYSLAQVQYEFMDHFLRGILTDEGLTVYLKHYPA